MGLLDQIELDNSFMVEGDFARNIKLIEKNGSEHNVKGLVKRIGVRTDSDGLKVIGASTCITVRLSSLFGAIPDDGWTVTTSDVTGLTITGKVFDPMIDRAAGRATFFIGRN